MNHACTPSRRALSTFPLLLTAFILLLSSCTKNEFTVEGNISGGGHHTLTALYVAYSSATDELVSEQLMLQNGTFSLKGVTKYPTILFIFSPDRRLLYPVYAEKGDKLTLKGDYNHPHEWQIKGNKPMEDYCAWMRLNEALLPSPLAGSASASTPSAARSSGRGTPQELNRAISLYVKAHPKDLCSALLLLAHYDRLIDEEGFNSLWAGLGLDAQQKERLLHVAMASLSEAQTKAAKLPVVPMTLRTTVDTLSTFSPGRFRVSVLYFWKNPADANLRTALRLMSKLPADIGVADINLDPDLRAWANSVENDTTRRRTPLQAFGGPMNQALRRLALPGAPYVIVADSLGRQLYRGTDINEALKIARQSKSAAWQTKPAARQSKPATRQSK